MISDNSDQASFPSHQIKVGIYKLLLLIVISTTLLVGIFSFYRNFIENKIKVSNDYHLACISHYQTAKDHLRVNEINKLKNSDQKVTNSFAPFNESISLALNIEKEHLTPQFNVLIKKLFQQSQPLLEPSYPVTPYEIEELTITLKQLVGIHQKMRADTLQDLRISQTWMRNILIAFSVIILVVFIIWIRNVLYGINHLIKKQENDEKQIYHQANFDYLTDLPNRRNIRRRIAESISISEKAGNHFALLFLDMDDFKKINDTLGHDSGDKLLKEASERLKKSIRSQDIVGRLGGDEFIILIRDIKDSQEAEKVIRRTIAKIGNSYTLEGHELLVTFSVGVALYPRDGSTIHDLLKNADSAMYQSKDHGRNTYSFYTKELNDRAFNKLIIEEQIHSALSNNELSLHYQPKWDIKNNRICGAEALLRWNNPKLGMISPDTFIPVAEQTGLIVEFGCFVLQEALAFTKEIQRKYDPDFQMAINISPRQFRDPNLCLQIEDAVRLASIDERCIDLEITEGVLMNGDKLVNTILGTWDRSGMNIAMDDFGTGYSSLSYVQKYPFDTIKIDRSFAAGLENDKKTKGLLQAAISMAHALDLKVVTEGIENQSQYEVLKELQCDYAQGFHLGKPMAPEKFIDFLCLKHNID